MIPHVHNDVTKKVYNGPVFGDFNLKLKNKQ